MNQIEIGFGTFLYEKDCHYYIRNEAGRIEKIPKNKFAHNEIVQTTDKHYSQKSFTRLKTPTYNKARGWIYAENFINRNSYNGGSSFWNDEEMYRKLQDPIDILYAKRLALKESIDKLNARLKSTAESLSKIEYALKISIDNYNGIIDRCIECGVLYDYHNQFNPNKKLCKSCGVLSQKP